MGKLAAQRYDANYCYCYSQRFFPGVSDVAGFTAVVRKPAVVGFPAFAGVPAC